MLRNKIEIVYRYDPDDPSSKTQPTTAEEARLMLERGNRGFAELLTATPLECGMRRRMLPLDPRNFGFGDVEGEAPTQTPFAAVLACSDARVPTEQIFGGGANDMFVVRVAGNVLGDECLGSLRYAAHHFATSMKLAVVLAHASCGAVTEAADAFLDPERYLSLATNHSLRAILDQILVSVRAAALAIDAVHGRDAASKSGYRRALIELSVSLNCVWNAFCLQEEFRTQSHDHVTVVYGVYDLASRYIRLPYSKGDPTPAECGLFAPPRNADEFRMISRDLAAGEFLRHLLES